MSPVNNVLSESRSVVSESVTPWMDIWNSPGQNTGAGYLSLLQGSLQPRSPALQVDSSQLSPREGQVEKPPKKPEDVVGELC